MPLNSFAKMRVLSALRMKHLPFIQTTAQHDVIIAIGEANAASIPINYKQLSLLELMPPTTLQRTLKRLHADALITKTQGTTDSRHINYALTESVANAYAAFFSAAEAEFSRN